MRRNAPVYYCVQCVVLQVVIVYLSIRLLVGLHKVDLAEIFRESKTWPITECARF